MLSLSVWNVSCGISVRKRKCERISSCIGEERKGGGGGGGAIEGGDW